jgi:hypothetical protein
VNIRGAHQWIISQEVRMNEHGQRFARSRVLLLAAIAGLVFIASSSAQGQGTGRSEIVSLRDFSKEEVKAVGITVTKDVSITIDATGCADRSVWNTFDDSDESDNGLLYAGGWIIDAGTRNVVWEMSRDNSTGKSALRKCQTTLTLKPGSYEVYYAAYGYASSSGLTHFSGNIDRREHPRKGRKDVGEFFKELFGGGADFTEEFMDHAKNDWGIEVSVDDNDRGAVTKFDAPRATPRIILASTGVGDGAYVRKMLTVARDADVHVYAIGEGRGRKEMFDYGWIVNAATRQRAWQMDFRDCRPAGGAKKNVLYDGTVNLPAGTYEVVYVTDASHSSDDWNAMPPHDPFNYGLTISAANDKDKNAITIADVETSEKNVIVQLTKMRNDDQRSGGFMLKEPTQVRIYAVGESHGEGHPMADYGWIIDAKTRERVWTMDEGRSEHAGGGSKNRLVDEVITLPAGSYVASYQTDDSHAYGDWNDDPPFDAEHWGLTISGVAKGFDPAKVKSYSDGSEEGVLAQLVRVRDDRHLRKSFSLDHTTKVRIYALGESDGDEMADYGWIEDVKNGDVVWEMKDRGTTHAGGATKNRMVNRVISLDKGDYELHYKTDGSHSYNDWNDDAPQDPTHWGITIYKEE